MSYSISQNNASRSFPAGDAFFDGAVADGDILLHLGYSGPFASVVVNMTAAEHLGLTKIDVDLALRAALGEKILCTFSDASKTYRVILDTDPRWPDAVAFLPDIKISGRNDCQISLAAIALIEMGAWIPVYPDVSKTAILVELGSECLAVHTLGEPEHNILGFARYRNGKDAPSKLIELVRGENTSQEAVDAASAMFKEAGFTVAVCADQAGRIVDRLVRPKYNAALRFLDEGLATQADMDLTCKLGLGYADGPIERVVRGGLAHHYDVTKALFDIYGTPAYAPARRAAVAKAKQK